MALEWDAPGPRCEGIFEVPARVLVDFTLPADSWDPGLVQPRTPGDRRREHAHVPAGFGDEHLNDSLAERPQEVCGWERVADLVVGHRESIVYI